MKRTVNIELARELTTSKEFFSPFYKQLFAMIFTVLQPISGGASIGYSATLLPQLKNSEDFSEITYDEQSWIASIVPLAVILGTAISGLIAAKFGRRRAQQITALPSTVGWVMIASANNLSLLLLGRFLCGLSMGVHMSISSMFIGEISSPEYRGFLLACISTAVTVGVGYVHLLGTFVYWKFVAVVIAALPFTSGCLAAFFPETPSWLASKKRFDEARASFYWYRGTADENKTEIDTIIETETKSSISEQNFREKVKYFIENLQQPEFYKPVVILCLFFVMLQFSGAVFLAFYGVQIFKEVLNGDVDEYTVILTLDGVKIASSILACIALKHIKTRVAIAVSGFTASITMAVFVICLYINDQSLTWLLLLTITLYVVSLTLGVISLPWCLLGELFPLNNRSFGVSFCSIVSSLLLFLSSKTAPSMFLNLGMTGAFIVYTLITLTVTIVLLFILPETKGKTLHEIEESFKSKIVIVPNNNNVDI